MAEELKIEYVTNIFLFINKIDNILRKMRLDKVSRASQLVKILFLFVTISMAALSTIFNAIIL